MCIVESVKEKGVSHVQVCDRQKSFTEVGEALLLDVGREGVKLLLDLVFGFDLDLAITDDGINEKVLVVVVVEEGGMLGLGIGGVDCFSLRAKSSGG